jgi:uridine kinase
MRRSRKPFRAVRSDEGSNPSPSASSFRPRIETFSSLAERILAAPQRAATRLVAVDGHGGSGKSTFANRLAEALGGAFVVHTDDFASWKNPIEWWPRLEEQVLQPMLAGGAARYQRYDWNERRLAEWHDIPPGSVVLIEGVSAARRAIADSLILAAWLEAPRGVCLERGVARDGEPMRASWIEWLRAEERHFRVDHTRERADLVVDGAPTIPHDPARSYVRLA